MNFLKALFLFFIVVFQQQCFAQETTWENFPALSQLERDKTLVPIGKGAVFCPSMTDPESEPYYGVLEKGKIVQDGKMGHRIVLSPGTYTVVYGSGTVNQMMKKKVRVEEGSTSLIKADWAGLVIEVINESRSNIRDYYELYDFTTGVSFGIGQGVEEGFGDELKTWILPPGIYKIVKPGDNINAVRDFGTIRLLPGELVRTTLVIDSKTNNFLGFGRISANRQIKSSSSKKWKGSSELSGNALLNYTPTGTTGTNNDLNFTSTVQWLTDARYESGRHIFPFWSNFEEGLSMDDNKVLHKYTDKMEVRFTYIYKLSDMVSPYIRFNAESRIFETNTWFDKPEDYFKTNAAGDTVKTVKGADDIKLGSYFSPIYLKQGFGLNSHIISSIPINFNLRAGYGARQAFARGSYLYNSTTHVLYPVTETDITGMEMLLLGDIRLGRYIIFDTEFDILMPGEKRKTWIYDGENRLRINLTSFISILLKMEYWKDESVDKTQTTYQTYLRFSKFL